jgi:general secretion pathway protein K
MIKPRSKLRKLAGTNKLIRDESGVALIMVLITCAVLSAIVIDFQFRVRISTQMAANSRDRVKAYYLARSAANLARLVLHFQGQVDQATGGMLKLYQIIPIESDLAKALTSGEIGEGFGLEGMNLGDQQGFGEFNGSFYAEIEDEYSKINVNSLDSLTSIASPITAEIFSLIGGYRYEAMFEGPDSDGQYTTPADIIVAMHDWIDADNSTDVLNIEAVIQDPLSQALLFQPGTQMEDSRYDMLDDPYKNKNDPFFTVDELYMIRGIDDDFMQEFGNKFTVYSDSNLLVNLSSVNDPVVMLSLLCMQPENLPLCTEQGLPQLLEVLAMFFDFRSMMQLSTLMVPNTEAIQGFFMSMGPSFSPHFLKNLAPFSDTFSVKAIGEVGEITVTIQTIVKNTAGGQELLYWRVI